MFLFSFIFFFFFFFNDTPTTVIYTLSLHDALPIPARLAGPGRDPAVGQPARELADRDAVVDVAVEHLAHDLRLSLVDLPEPLHVLGLLDVPVAVRRTGHHRLRAAARAVQLPAAGALGDLRALVLGDHPLELA